MFIGCPGMTPVMQMRVGWTLATADGRDPGDRVLHAVRAVTKFDPRAEGFGDITVDLTPRTTAAAGPAVVSADEGRRVYERYGCMACHSTDAATRLGPTFRHLYGSDRTFSGGVVRVTADDSYLRESILEPSAKVVEGFGRLGMGMPSYAGVLTDAQIDSLILFIRSLAKRWYSFVRFCGAVSGTGMRRQP